MKKLNVDAYIYLKFILYHPSSSSVTTATTIKIINLNTKPIIIILITILMVFLQEYSPFTIKMLMQILIKGDVFIMVFLQECSLPAEAWRRRRGRSLLISHPSILDHPWSNIEISIIICIIITFIIKITMKHGGGGGEGCFKGKVQKRKEKKN